MRLHRLTRSLVAPLFVAAAAVAVAAAPVQEAANARVLRVYDVSLLVEPVEDHPGPSLEALPAHGGVIFGSHAESEAPFQAGGLVALIRGSIEPDTWRHEAVRCEVADTTLEVVQSPAVHAEVAELLRRLRRDVGLVVEVDVAVWRVTAAQSRAVLAASRNGSGVFPAGGATAALAAAKASALDRATVVLRSGQRAHASTVRTRSYLGDFDVEVAQEAQLADPVIHTERLGLVADLKAVPSRDGSRVALETQLAWAESASTDRRAETSVGTIELPERRVTTVRGLADVAYGEQWCAAAAADGAGSVCFVLSAQRRVPGGGGGAKASSARRVTRVYSIAGLTFEASQFPAPVLNPGRGMAKPGSGGMAFGDDEAEEGVRLDPRSVAALIQANLDPDSWDHPRNRIVVRSQTLLVTHAPAMQQQVAGYLAKLEGGRPPTLRIESVLVSSDAALDQLLTASKGAALADAAVAGWLAAQPGRIAGHATVSAQNRQMVFAALEHTVPYVAEYDVELAQKSEISDPVVRTGLEGFLVGGRPVIAGDGSSIALDLKPDRAVVTRPIRTIESGFGPVSLLEVARRHNGATPVVASGAWTAQRFGRDAQGRPMVLLTTVRRTR
jgi:hypothetical protein